MSVCAVVGRSTAQLDQALAAQGANLDAVVTDSRLRSGLGRALATDSEWIWVLDGSAVPRPDALQRLLDGLGRVGELPYPSLLEGVVVTSGGRVHEQRGPWYRRFHLDVAMRSVDRRLLPIRGSSGPVLVHRHAAEAQLPRAGAPIAPGALLEWTAKALRYRTGYLVPESESEIVGLSRDPMKDPATAVRLLFGRAVVRLDRLALVLELARGKGLANIDRWGLLASTNHPWSTVFSGAALKVLDAQWIGETKELWELRSVIKAIASLADPAHAEAYAALFVSKSPNDPMGDFVKARDRLRLRAQMHKEFES